MDFLTSLVARGEPINITRSDAAFQSQALFPFSAKTLWGQKVDKYDCRMLLTESISYSATTSQERPDSELQMARYSSLLLYLSEGSSESDILEWSKLVLGNRKTGSVSEIMSPTQFEEEKKRFLKETDESQENTNPPTSLPRWSNRQLDKIALHCGIPRFSKAVYREDEQESQDAYFPSRGDRKAIARERKRYQLHLSDRPSMETTDSIQQHRTQNTVSTVSFEISTAEEDDVVILEDHLSKSSTKQNTPQIINQHRIQSEDTQSSIPHPQYSDTRGNAPVTRVEVHTRSRETATHETQIVRSKSPEKPRRSSSPSSRSPVRPRYEHSRDYDRHRDYYSDYRPSQRSPSSSPPRKKSKPSAPPTSSGSKSKLDRELEALEAKYSKKKP